MVSELQRYGVTVAGLQETKWFGAEAYRVGESVVLAAGRPVPGVGQAKKRGEGVAIVLTGPAIGRGGMEGASGKRGVPE